MPDSSIRCAFDRRRRCKKACRDEREVIGEGFSKRDNVSYDAALRTYLSNRLPAERFVNEDAVAGLISFLCSPYGRDINGAALPIDGAWSAGR